MNLFERWCALNGHKPFGASPETLARFVADIAPMGIEQVWSALQERRLADEYDAAQERGEVAKVGDNPYNPQGGRKRVVGDNDHPQITLSDPEISRAHYTHLLPDPTVGETVATALNNIVRVDPPRSWPKELHDRFKMLPHEIQHWLARRQAADDRLIRKLQNELATLKRKIDGTLSAETVHQSAA